MHSADTSLDYIENRPTGQSDLGLVIAARAGSEVAFAEPYRLYANRLYKKIFSITKNPEDTGDVLKETLMRAYLALASFECRSQFLFWLTRIAIDASLMALRKRRSRHEASCESLSFGEDEMPQLQVKDPYPNPEESCLLSERSHRALRAINALNSPLRTVLQMQINRESSLKEIAESLDVSVATVKARLYRARRRIALQTQSEVRMSRHRTGTSG